MPEIQNQYFTPNLNIQPNWDKFQQSPIQRQPEQVKLPQTLQDEFVSVKKKNGLIERLYDFIKNKTNLGLGSKKVQEIIAKADKGEINQEEAKSTIQKFRTSQDNSAQAFGDLLSVGASGITFFGISKLLKMKNSEILINEKYYNDIVESGRELSKKSSKVGFWAKLTEKIINTAKSKNKLIAISAVAAGLVGGYTKYWALKFNRIGSDEFKYSKKDFNGAKTPYDKMAYKLEKKQKNKERHIANLRNFASGAINGLMMPITMLGGGILGIPALFAGNSLNRYFIGNHTDKEKSFDSYLNNLKDDSITHATIAVAAAIPMAKKVNWTRVYDTNLKKATDKLINAKLKPSEFAGKTTYQELDSILMKNDSIKAITEDFSLSLDEKIKRLTNLNIFAVKFEQISGRSDLSRALTENCPATRTLEEAQEYITQKIGNGYKVSKCLGVGTIAETYLAKSPDGKDVCLKIIKEGISEAKINQDKESFINIIKELNRSKDEEEYLIKNIEDLADGIKKEVNLQNEMDAAQKLVNFTKTAKVVKPIEVKNGVYIMEKADGISLQSLIKLTEYKNILKYIDKEILNKKNQKTLEEYKDWKEEILADIKKIEARTPEYGNLDLSETDAKYMFEQYMKVLVEQFYKIDKNGKTLHADIHPGNIFIDINAVKNKNGNVFTLIDTGNTIDLTAKQAADSLKLTQFVERGAVDDIANYMLDGANLNSSGLNKEEAIKKVSDELKKIFFDNETSIEKIDNSEMFALVSNIMKKYKIMPNSNQLNLDKAQTSANSSFDNLLEIWFSGVENKISQKESTSSQVVAGVGAAKDLLLLSKKFKDLKKQQEKLNLLQLSPVDRIKYKNNPNLLPTNSEDYLTFKLKQNVKSL